MKSLFPSFVFLLQISPSFFTDYLCPVEANAWYLFDNQTDQIHQWIYDQNIEEFSPENSLRGNEKDFHLICADIEQNFYRTIRIDEKQLDINWMCDYGRNEGRMEIYSWIFNSSLQPKKVFFQIENFFRMEILPNDLVRISRKLIEQILSTIQHSSKIFYELILNYGDEQGSIAIQLRPLIEQRYYLVPIDSHHRNDSYLDIDCSSS